MATVLVTDGGQRAALAAVRSLGAAGHRVLVGGGRGRGIAGRSRHAAGVITLPSPLDEPAAFARRVAEEVSARGVEVVLPVTEAAILSLLDAREALAPARIPFPDAATFRRAARKDALVDAELPAPLRMPAQTRVDTAAASLPEALSFPVVVKPSRSVVGTPGDETGPRRKTSVGYAGDRDDLEQRLAALPPGAFPVLLQERIEGDGVGLFFLMHGGGVRARFAHRRLREKPPSGGVSVLRESIDVAEAWFEAGAELLRRLEWDGVAMVELKVDGTSGTPYVMEVNPRLWGSLQLAVDAGVDFPRLLVELALGQDPPAVMRYRVGVRSRWTMGDVDHLVIRLLRSRDDLDLPASAPGRARTLLDFVAAFSPGVRGEVFRFGDPAPGLHELLAWPRRR